MKENQINELQTFLYWLECTPVCAMKFSGKNPLVIRYSSKDLCKKDSQFDDLEHKVGIHNVEDFKQILEAFKNNKKMERLALDCLELEAPFNSLLIKHFPEIIDNKTNLVAFKLLDDLKEKGVQKLINIREMGHSSLSHSALFALTKKQENSKLQYLEFGRLCCFRDEQVSSIYAFIRRNSNLVELHLPVIQKEDRRLIQAQLEFNQKIHALYTKLTNVLFEPTFKEDEDPSFQEIMQLYSSGLGIYSKKCSELYYLNYFSNLIRNQVEIEVACQQISDLLENDGVSFKDLPLLLKYILHLLGEEFAEKLPAELMKKIFLTMTYFEDKTFSRRELSFITPRLALSDPELRRIFYQRILYLAILGDDPDWFRIAYHALSAQENEYKLSSSVVEKFPFELLRWEFSEMQILMEKTQCSNGRAALLEVLEGLSVETIEEQYDPALASKLLMALNHPSWIELIKKPLFPLTSEEWQSFNTYYRDICANFLDLDKIKMQIANLSILQQIEAYCPHLQDKQEAFQAILNEIANATTPQQIDDAIHNEERNQLISKNQTLKSLEPDSVDSMQYKVHDLMVHTIWFRGKESTGGGILYQFVNQVEQILSGREEKKGFLFGFCSGHVPYLPIDIS